MARKRPLQKKIMLLPDLSAQEIRDCLSGSTSRIGRELIFFPVTASTNSVAMELAEKGGHEGLVIIADSQTQGRGRRGRQWVSPPGKNLYMSIILKPVLPVRDAGILTLMAAVACTSAVKNASSIPVSIKWPNDLMVENKKIGGILAEIKSEGDSLVHAVIGIGVNINIDAADMPEEIGTIATSVKIEAGVPQPRTLYALEIIKALDFWYDILLESGKGPIIDSWNSLSSTIGRHITVSSENNQFRGVAEGIDAEGALILRLSDNKVTKIYAGDVTIGTMGHGAKVRTLKT